MLEVGAGNFPMMTYPQKMFTYKSELWDRCYTEVNDTLHFLERNYSGHNVSVSKVIGN
jgi:hypothetical protein